MRVGATTRDNLAAVCPMRACPYEPCLGAARGAAKCVCLPCNCEQCRIRAVRAGAPLEDEPAFAFRARAYRAVRRRAAPGRGRASGEHGRERCAYSLGSAAVVSGSPGRRPVEGAPGGRPDLRRLLSRKRGPLRHDRP
jgi:hypothetical protein